MVFDKMQAKGGHEQVLFCCDNKTGLKAIIAIHSTALGPALGGCRMYPYATEEQALMDVLNLSRAMSYKAAAAGLDLGGGKSVIIGDPEKAKSLPLFEAFGRHVESLRGRYILAKDSGISSKDIQHISKSTAYALGRPKSQGGIGDPSYYTALGVFYAIEEAARLRLQKESLKGLKIMVQGAGGVGLHLIQILMEKEAHVLVSEIKESALAEVKTRFPQAQIVAADQALRVRCDIFSPCALGGIITEEQALNLTCSIVAGGANNQLSSSAVAQDLLKKGIFYVPDFVVNCGGLIQVFASWKGRDKDWIFNKIKEVKGKTTELFHLSQKRGISTSQAAMEMARKKIEDHAGAHSLHTPQRA